MLNSEINGSTASQLGVGKSVRSFTVVSWHLLERTPLFLSLAKLRLISDKTRYQCNLQERFA